jgi:hypothetical protein
MTLGVVVGPGVPLLRAGGSDLLARPPLARISDLLMRGPLPRA